MNVEVYPGIEIDTLSREKISKLQLFVTAKNDSVSDIPDAIDQLSDRYKYLYDSYAWGVGIKRLIVRPESISGFVSQIKTYESLFYSATLDFKSFMFTNFSNDRDFYIYYSEDHQYNGGLDFCDNGYHCFEFGSMDLLPDICKMLGMLCTLQRNGKNSECLPVCTGGELSLVPQKGIIKMKIMPKNTIEFNNVDSLYDYFCGIISKPVIRAIIDSKK